MRALTLAWILGFWTGRPANDLVAQGVPACAAVVTTPADSATVVHSIPGSIGDYRLVAVVDTGKLIGAVGVGRLTIWRTADGRLLAATTLDLTALQAPIIGNLAGRNDAWPGMTLVGRSLVLPELNGQPTSHTAFRLDLVTPTGLAGRWYSRWGEIELFRDGEIATESAGHFCAERVQP